MWEEVQPSTSCSSGGANGKGGSWSRRPGDPGRGQQAAGRKDTTQAGNVWYAMGIVGASFEINRMLSEAAVAESYSSL